jgi:hypothetical protein
MENRRSLQRAGYLRKIVKVKMVKIARRREVKWSDKQTNRKFDHHYLLGLKGRVTFVKSRTIVTARPAQNVHY